MSGSDDELENNDSSSVEDEDESLIDEEEDHEEDEQKDDDDDKENAEEEEEEGDIDAEDDNESSCSDNSDIEDSKKHSANLNKNTIIGGTLEDDDDDDDDDDTDNTYMQKFNSDINRQYVTEFHPESMINNYDEINALSNVVRDRHNNIIDSLHRTLPYLTKYERARVLGQRAKQINSGAKAFVKVPENIIDGYLIAELELTQKRIPFIIRRPIPGGACEYWKLKDLEIIGF
jgi:DNA-directed RNA polymerases I, II, and III subunit RPABC2